MNIKLLIYFRHIDYLILNAGVFALPHLLTDDNLETIFQVCHLSHYYLTLELSELLNHSRIVVLSSESHRFSNLPADDLNEQNLSPPLSKFSSMMAYNNAKLCNVLFARELGKRWQHRNISVFCVHPGNMISSSISRNYWVYRLFFAIVRPFTKSLVSIPKMYACSVVLKYLLHYFSNKALPQQFIVRLQLSYQDLLAYILTTVICANLVN